ADSIRGILGGRILQGAGAISAAVMGLLSDLTREQHRTKAMDMIGMTIGLSFAIAKVVGPVITGVFGLTGLYQATVCISLQG
ncbi:MFS transporter, partial [Pseudomonas syringae pv. tagetis]